MMAQFGGRGITNAIESEIIMARARAVLRAEYQEQRSVNFRVTVQGGRLRVTDH